MDLDLQRNRSYCMISLIPGRCVRLGPSQQGTAMQLYELRDSYILASEPAESCKTIMTPTEYWSRCFFYSSIGCHSKVVRFSSQFLDRFESNWERGRFG